MLEGDKRKMNKICVKLIKKNNESAGGGRRGIIKCD